jgi:hypothetical protein
MIEKYLKREISDPLQLAKEKRMLEGNFISPKPVLMPVVPGLPVPLPGQTAPGQVSPGQTAPGQTVPGQVSPGQTAPGQTLPGQPAQVPAPAHTDAILPSRSEGATAHLNPFPR